MAGTKQYANTDKQLKGRGALFCRFLSGINKLCQKAQDLRVKCLKKGAVIWAE